MSAAKGGKQQKQAPAAAAAPPAKQSAPRDADDEKDDGGTAAPGEVEAERANDAATGMSAGAEAEEGSEPSERFSLDILANIKASQLQNGLRHGDYQRYRQYCSRRLRRLRVGVKFTNPRRDFKLRPLEVSTVTDVRHLALALVQAERAWAYAMQLKNDMTEDTQRKRCHLLKRLGKAATWAALLEKLCAARADTRTQLQAEAYAAWLSASVMFERNMHEKALAAFLHAKEVYDKLGSIGGSAMQLLCEERVAALQDSIRFSKYMLRHKAGAGAGNDDDEDIDAELGSGGAVNELLAAKLETLRQEKLAEAAQSLDTVQWQGKTVPVSSEKLRISFVEANSLRAQLDKALEQQKKQEAAAAAAPAPAAASKGAAAADAAASGEEDEAPKLLSLFQRLFGAYDSALKVLRDALLEPAQLESHKAHLLALRDYATAARIDVQLVRNRNFARHIAQTLREQEARPAAYAHRKKHKPDEVVLLYEKIAANVQELLDLATSSKNASQTRVLQASLASARALRGFYLAESYRRLRQWQQAFVLYGRALELAGEADAAAGKLNKDEQASATVQEEAAIVDREVKQQARSLRGQVHAQALLEEAEKKVAASAPAAGAASDKKAASAAAQSSAVPLLQRLDLWDGGDASSQHSLLAFPPSFQTAPAKPILFDLAFNAISYPDVKSRLQQAQARRAGGQVTAPAAAASAAAPAAAAKPAAASAAAAAAPAKKPQQQQQQQKQKQQQEEEESEEEEEGEEEEESEPAPAPARKAKQQQQAAPAAAAAAKKIAPPGETKAARAERLVREAEEERQRQAAEEEAKKKAASWGIGGLVGKMFGR